MNHQYCSCVSIDVGMAEMPEFFRRSRPTARTMHMCTECHRVIQKGEMYELCVGKWGGDFLTFKTCTDCLSIRNSFFCGVWGYGQLISDLQNHVGELAGEVDESCLVGLTDRARDIVCEMIEGSW